jgi:hypothetical protein
MVPSVRLTPLMREAGEKKKKPPPKPKAETGKRGDMDDEIPSEGDASKSGRGNRLSRPRQVVNS